MSKNRLTTRRSFLKKGITGILSMATLSALSLGYSFRGERFWYDVKRVNLTFNHLPPAFHGLRLVQFSDTHLGHYFGQQELREVVEQIHSLQPDIICFTGDLADQGGVEEYEDSILTLSQLKAPFGKYAVLGNHDYRGNVSLLTSVLEAAQFKVLVNRQHQINKDDQSIRMVGVDDSLAGQPDLEQAMNGVGDEDFIILLSHTPDFADECKNYPITLQLSGHSHGGQIRIPLFGSVITPPGAKKYINGLFPIADSNLLLYVNRGIGTTILPLRFACRPEITLFTFHKEF
ncbi:hypothetical protein BEP19_11800 [Ammoniphilus oxalaticus]|uniref:Calcineurin-like phosphoesterase domain-containing protein n=1 Tax=Ammoniphilus oxalaticus TaxID=66863 RepID=A0A419SGK7_9BACL|nr:metallophosphoesterase [Ammoniphilus oxalaticus]RKD22913.1 hypothetical protein BEP19_11800 [Ammoniphilus oxalaticus]